MFFVWLFEVVIFLLYFLNELVCNLIESIFLEVFSVFFCKGGVLFMLKFLFVVSEVLVIVFNSLFLLFIDKVFCSFGLLIDLFKVRFFNFVVGFFVLVLLFII